MDLENRRYRRNVKVLTIVVVPFVVLLLQILGLFDVWELRWYSHQFRVRGPLTGWSAADSSFIKRGTDIALVEVDAESWRLIPETWPYSRGNVWARAIRNLSLAGAKIIAIDVQFDVPDARSEYLKLVADNNNDFVHGDEQLAREISLAQDRGTEIILSSKIVLEPSLSPPEYVSLPVDVIMKSGPETGIINDYLDEDGFARRYAIAGFMEHEPERAYLTLGLKSVKAFAGIRDEEIPEYLSKNSLWNYGDYSIQALRNSHTFLINFYGPPSALGKDKGQKWGTFPVFSLASVLDTRDFDLKASSEDIDWMDQFLPGQLPEWVELIEDSIQREEVISSLGLHSTQKSPFKDKIVLIGVSVEVFHDYKSTPYYNYQEEKQFMPGVEVQANAIQTILDSNYIHVIGGVITEIGRDGFPWLHLFFLMLASVVTVLIAMERHLIRSSVELLLLVLLLVYGKYALFMGDIFWGVRAVSSEFLPLRWLEHFSFLQLKNPEPGESKVLLLVATMITIAVTFFITVLYQYLSEQQNKKFLREMFQSYVSPELIQMMYQRHEMPELGGLEGFHTAFFSDIQSFSSFSEILEPAQLSAVMNEYLSAMTDILLRNQGTLDKYIGDAIVAFFGAPVELKNHEFLACSTAILMNQKAEELRNKWKTEGIYPELVCNLRHRIGINSGEMVTGNMGSTMRMNYTMIGDNVNLAARLESSAKQYGIYLHVSEYTLEKVKGYFEYRPIDYIRVKGKNEPVRTYELLGFNGQLSEQQEMCIDYFNAAHSAYEKREWDSAVELFKKAQNYEEKFPYRPTTPSEVYIERCNILKENPPSEDWDGVWTLTSK